jgi:sec-independent protein translocase protein TatC
MSAEEKLPITDHLEELRHRLIKSAIAVAVGFGLAFAFKEKLFDILVWPLKKVMRSGDALIYTNLPEAFFVFLKTALLAGIMLASPVILYQFWMFVAPGLYDKERRLLLPILFLSTIFFVGGALFGYFFVFPVGFEFFLSFATDVIRPMPSMKEYLSLASTMLLAFGAVFELPLALTFLARLGVVSAKFLSKQRKYAILIIFIAAAILTPGPDIMSQLLMAGPMMLLYELSIIGAKIFGKKKEPEPEIAESEDPA